MAKDLNSLEKSRDRREEINAKYGFIPVSIMLADKSDKSMDLEAEDRCYENYTAADREKHGKLYDVFSISSRSVRAGALSRYPQNIGRYLVKMYSNEGDTVLDPFAGHNSRMELVYKLGRNYIGYDISHKFMETNQKISKEIMGGGVQPDLFISDNTIKLVEGDSRNIDLNGDLVDMVLTSPPYWNIEYYGDEEGQLGKCKTYNKFMDDMLLVIQKCVDHMKSGTFCCFSINDFRVNGIFYCYHASIIQAFKKVGLLIHDIVIVDFGSAFGAAFASQLEDQRRSAKRHEYVIVGRKP